MNIRRSLTLLMVLTIQPAYAGTPATPAPTGLDRIAAAVTGTWNTEAETYSSELSQAGHQTLKVERECWKSGEALKCLMVSDDKLIAENVYTYDKASDSYRERVLTAQGAYPDFTLTIKGDTWTYLEEIKSKQGDTIHLRLVRIFKTPDSVESKTDFKHDTGDWITSATGTETRAKPTS